MKTRPKARGHPFLELFASSLQEDYRLPVLELFAFLYVLGTFALAGMFFGTPSVSEQQACWFVTSVMGLPLSVFGLLIFKNIAFGLGNDLDKGILQTVFSYPLKRRAILTAKLLSAIGAALLLLLVIQLFAWIVLAPSVLLSFPLTVILTVVAGLCYPLLLAGAILFVTLLVKKGSLALVLGILLSFASSILQSIAQVVSWMSRSALPLQMLSVFNPAVAVQYHYRILSLFGGTMWELSLAETLAYVGAGYSLIAVGFFLSYYFFCKRLNL